MAYDSRRRSKSDREYHPRKGRAGGLRLHWLLGSEYAPVFPNVFRERDLKYSQGNYDVFHTHYIEHRYGPKPLLRLEHKAAYEMLYFQAEMGEHFHTTEMAQRLAISRHTLTGYFDTLENLRLIRRVRHGRSFTRLINIVVADPFYGGELDRDHFRLGYKLYARVHQGFVQAERKRVGPSRWPLLEWDYQTMVKMLADKETPHALQQIRIAFDYAAQRISGNETEYANLAGPERWDAFKQLVEKYCRREGLPYTGRLYHCALAIERLGQE